MFGNSRTFTLVVAVALLGPALSGCMGGGDGTAAFYVRDAPEDDWAHVNVTFTEVRVHQGEGDEDGNDTDEDEWITVASNESGREIDLLAFSGNGARALLGSDELEAGTYNQVLIDVTEAYGIDKDSGEREDFELTQPELRLTRAWEIEADSTTHVVADLDLDRSIRQQGEETYRFNPVIGQVLVETNDEEPGDRRGDGAGDGGDDPSEEGEAPMTTYIKDAPSDELTEVWLTFDEVEVHYAGNVSEDEANETEEGRWLTTVNESRELDLMAYNESGSKAFLGDAEVPEGRYTQIRINVTDAWARDNNDTRVEVEVASETARVVRNWTVQDNATTTQVTIDLDLDQSLVERSGDGDDRGGDGQAGGNGSEDGQEQAPWILTPVIGQVAVEEVPVDPRADQQDPQDAAEDVGGG